MVEARNLVTTGKTDEVIVIEEGIIAVRAALSLRFDERPAYPSLLLSNGGYAVLATKGGTRT